MTSRSAQLARLRDLPLTYPEVGATAGELPPGYRHVRRTWPIGIGRSSFDVAAEMVMTFQILERAGSRIEATAPRAATGVDVLQRPGIGPLRLSVPCRIVDVVEEDRARGFAFGTLRGHPEIGEERFVVSYTTDEAIDLTITVFSRPGRWFTRLAGPVNRLGQHLMLDRYAKAIAARRY